MSLRVHVENVDESASWRVVVDPDEDLSKLGPVIILRLGKRFVRVVWKNEEQEN